MIDTHLQTIIAEQPYPLLAMTLSGAHLYGFPSPDSDYDLRGVYILPVHEVLGLYEGRESITSMSVRSGLEIDLVMHDIKKFFSLLVNKKSGLVLEQIYSPLLLYAAPEHEELKQLARGFISRHHYHHYYGFAESQWKLFNKEQPRRVKPLLYIYRVLLTGIHLMQTGEVEANLVHLNELFKLPYIPDLIARKLAGPEQSALQDDNLSFHQREYERLLDELLQASQRSSLPEGPTEKDKHALDDLLIRLRLQKERVSSKP
ncbi:MAG: nucleotidyltransferase domain-containing protein [Ktedonobacteraceae bacterium]|nr:nucleotidyltransferase domain-containing protein [Ktedonobacteraceae bacterium]